MQSETLVTTSRVARTLGLSVARVRQLSDLGRIPCIRTADGWRLYDSADVERIAAERATRRSGGADGDDRAS
jgi:DNA-binding transcriptional MerR regulator